MPIYLAYGQHLFGASQRHGEATDICVSECGFAIAIDCGT